MGSGYDIYFTDMHSNLHHNQIDDLPSWCLHAKQVLDFWAVAYYPFHVEKEEGKMPIEDIYPDEVLVKDWNKIRHFLQNRDDPDFPVFLGYEWQGSGLDGDHNIFFKNDGEMVHPLRYGELRKNLGRHDAVAIPHHPAYALGHRGKNWDTHNEDFSPFAEIYSSHGSSESGWTDLPMGRHVHMGPRGGGTSLYDGLMKGKKVGIIASGDNHIVPGVFGYGYAAVLAKDKSRDALWSAFKERRVYGVTGNKIRLDYRLDGHCMGTSIDAPAGILKHDVSVTAGDAVTRVELIRNSVPIQTYVHNGTWENTATPSPVRFKFKLEMGWGPNISVFKDHSQKRWEGRVRTAGKILSVENCFTSFGQNVEWEQENEIVFDLTTYKSTQTGKWMGPSPVTVEGFIIEAEASPDSDMEFLIDGRRIVRSVKSILEDTHLIVFYDEARKLVKDAFGLDNFYRSDPFYHNAYKARILRGTPVEGYRVRCGFETESKEGDVYYMVKVYQRNGDLAWSSPVFLS